MIFLSSFLFSFVNKIETSLERYLGVQGGLSVCASTVHETFTDPAEVTYLSLADCGLTTVPNKFGLDFLPFFSFDLILILSLGFFQLLLSM